jgi:hypothetical protein
MPSVQLQSNTTRNGGWTWPSGSGWRTLSLPGPAVLKWASNYKEPAWCFCPGVLYWPMCWSEPLKLPDILCLCCKKVYPSFTCKTDASLLSWILISYGACVNKCFNNRDDKFHNIATNFTWYSFCRQLTSWSTEFLQKQCLSVIVYSIFHTKCAWINFPTCFMTISRDIP